MTKKRQKLSNPKMLDEILNYINEVATRYDVPMVDLCQQVVFSLLCQFVYDEVLNLDSLFMQVEYAVQQIKANRGERLDNPCGRKPLTKKMRSCVAKVSRKMGKKKAYPICRASVKR